MRIFSLICFLGILLSCASCTTQRRVTNNYLENINDTTPKEPVLHIEPIIQKNDLLSIRIYSASIHPEVDLPYNLTEPGASGSAVGSTSGFLVDGNGDIEYPRLGVVHAEGLTKAQLSDVIKKKLEGQLTQPSVIVRFLNYRITVLGEVRTPGTFTVPTERLTILEALGLAGDITEFGLKKNIKVVRENNGQREIGTVDLTSKSMFASPYYQLQQNDVVMVEQTGQRSKQEDRQVLAQQIGIASSVITAIALIITILK
jgi:polysaccharide export outer membrane protein